MSDEDAYMALVTSNSQSELTSLERGLHALGATQRGKRGKSIQAYAGQVGRKVTSVKLELYAAEVVTSVTVSLASAQDYTRHLAELHSAPAWLWPALVARLLADGWTVDAARKQVERSNCPLWPAMSAIARTTGREPCRRTPGPTCSMEERAGRQPGRTRRSTRLLPLQSRQPGAVRIVRVTEDGKREVVEAGES
jgi:hypothetical protein